MKTEKIDLYTYKNIPVELAAKVLGKGQEFVRFGLQQQTLPIGTAVKMSSIYDYHISPRLLENYSGTRFIEMEIKNEKNNIKLETKNK